MVPFNRAGVTVRTTSSAAPAGCSIYPRLLGPNLLHPFGPDASPHWHVRASEVSLWGGRPAEASDTSPRPLRQWGMASFEARVSTTSDTSVGEAAPVVVEFHNRHTGQHHAAVVDEVTGGHLLHLAIATCVSNDLFREASARGLRLTRVRVTADGGFEGRPCRSTGIDYRVELEGDAPEADLRALLAQVDDIAEIPAVLRAGAVVRLAAADVRSTRPDRD